MPSFKKGGLGRIFKIPLNPPLSKGEVKGGNMNKSIFTIIGIMLFLGMSMLCQSCASAKCMVDKQTCNFDCPSTIGLKQACEQKCNILYDVCRNKE
jgi:hypothetical protein